MKYIIQLEEIALLVFSYILFYYLPIPNKWFWIFLLVPDISMLGYMLGNKAGAWMYNIFHHRGIAIFLGLLGWWINKDWMIAVGIILFAHSTMDRVFGYGLKFEDSFNNTHLGLIGKHKDLKKTESIK